MAWASNESERVSICGKYVALPASSATNHVAITHEADCFNELELTALPYTSFFTAKTSVFFAASI